MSDTDHQMITVSFQFDHSIISNTETYKNLYCLDVSAESHLQSLALVILLVT